MQKNLLRKYEKLMYNAYVSCTVDCNRQSIAHCNGESLIVLEVVLVGDRNSRIQLTANGKVVPPYTILRDIALLHWQQLALHARHCLP
jgi:hypothetical protein